MSYEYDRPRRRARRGRVPPQLRAWVFGRRRKRYDLDPRRVRRYRRRYDPRIRIRRRPGLWATLSKALGVVAFVEQVTGKDRKAAFPGMSFTDKLKFLVDVMAQRIIGVSVFHMGVWPRTLNPIGIFNKWLGAGIGLIIAGMIPMVPYRGRLKSIGRDIAIGGGLGGLFDQPALQRPQYNPSIGAGVPPVVALQVQRSVW